jgi:hypothetical protein
MEAIKQVFLKYWFIGSALALALLYVLFQRRGQKLDAAYAEAQKQLLAIELIKIRERSQKSNEEYLKAIDDYHRLKSRHPELISRYGLFTGGTPAPKDKPSGD